MASHTAVGSRVPWRKALGGFTLIELLVVLAIVALMLTLALPRYFQHLEAAKETVLKENLRETRSAIDKFYGDTGQYPQSLEDLVSKKYLRAVPHDPVVESSTTWTIMPPNDGSPGKVFDLHSGAVGTTRGGVAFSEL